jgi:hypothetical protein
MEKQLYETALIYAYKVRDAHRYGLDPTEIHLAYQVKQPASSELNHQCEYGKEATAYFLKEFKEMGGIVRIVNSKKELVLPLAETKVQVPVPKRLIKEWGLKELVE